MQSSPLSSITIATALCATLALGIDWAWHSHTGNAALASGAAVISVAIVLAAMVVAAQSAHAFGEWLSWGLIGAGAGFYAAAEIAQFSVVLTNGIVVWQTNVLPWLQAAGALFVLAGIVCRTTRVEGMEAAFAGSFGLVVTAIAAMTPVLYGIRIAGASEPAPWEFAAPVIALSAAVVAMAIACNVWMTAPDAGNQPLGLTTLATSLGLSAVLQTIGHWTSESSLLLLGRWMFPLAAIGAVIAAVSQIRRRDGLLAIDRETPWLKWPPASKRLPLWSATCLAVAAMFALSGRAVIAGDLSVLASLCVLFLFGQQSLLLRFERDRVAALRDSAEEFRRLASVDRLTGLYNRDALESRLREEFERAIRHEQPLSLCYVDIDHFKAVNDSFGHHAGDAILREVAASFRHSARSIDFVGRLGGEEFVVIAPATWTADAMVLAERLRTQVEQRSIRARNGEPVKITVSVGVAGFPEHADDLFTLQDCADQALYMAKASGRNRSLLYGAADGA